MSWVVFFQMIDNRWVTFLLDSRMSNSSIHYIYIMQVESLIALQYENNYGLNAVVVLFAISTMLAPFNCILYSLRPFFTSFRIHIFCFLFLFLHYFSLAQLSHISFLAPNEISVIPMMQSPSIPIKIARKSRRKGDVPFRILSRVIWNEHFRSDCIKNI